MEEVQTTEEVVKAPKLSHTRKKFRGHWEHQFPNAPLNYGVDEKGEFVDMYTQSLYLMYMAGRKDQQFFEPSAFVIGSLEDKQLVFSDNPHIHHKHDSALWALNRLRKIHQNKFFFVFALSEAAFRFMKRQLGTEELTTIPMVTRPNKREDKLR